MKLNIEDINIMLIANSSPATKAYKKYFESKGIRYYTVTNANQIENIPQIIPVNGIVVDVATYIKSDLSEKTLLNEMEEIYPYIRVKWDESKNSINVMHHDDRINNLDNFIDMKACKFDPRVMRTSERQNISYNVVLSNTADFTGIQERACTLNASESGFFIITSSDLWKEGSKIHVVINELTLRTPIQATVLRKVSWGEEPFCIPGISIRIDSILDQQQDELIARTK